MSRLTLDIETIARFDYSIVGLKEEFERLSEKPEFLAACHPAFMQIVCIGMLATNNAGEQKEKALVADKGEKAMLEEFSTIIKSLDTSYLFVHWNGLDFDVPNIILRSLVHGVEISGGAWNRFKNLRRFMKDPHYDTMQWMCAWQGRSKLSLRVASLMFGLPDPKEKFKADGVDGLVAEGKWQDVAEYCLGDVRNTDALYLRTKDGVA